MKSMLRRFGVVALAALALAACDDDGVTGVDGDADLQIRMASDGSPAGAGLPLSSQMVAGPNQAPLHLDVVESIILPIGSVEAHQEGGGWVEIGAVNDDVDLLALPVEGIVLVGGDVPEGEYDRLRFFLSGQPTVVLRETVRVGRTTYEAGANPLRIPSVDQGGFRVAADFEVGGDEGEILTLVVDEDATLGHVTATGNGTLMIAPVLTVRNDDGEDVGEFDDDEDDEDDQEEVEFEGAVSAVGSSSLTLEDGTVILVDADTEFDGDLLSLAAVQEELDAGTLVEAEGEGELQADGSILADEIEFEVDDDGDGDTDDEGDEAEGTVLSIDEGAGTLVVFDLATQSEVTIAWTQDTEIEIEGDAETLAEVVAALAAGAAVEAEAEGTYDAAGVLVAETLEFEVDAG